jgi:polysaccharide biosynthesis PFTS motif protein
MMRGYRVLRDTSKLSQIAAVKQAITEHSLNLPLSSFSALIMGKGIVAGELVIRQNLLIRLGGNSLNSALLLAVGKKDEYITLPIPKEWREILKKHGFKISNYRSAILWNGYVISVMLLGIARIVKISLSVFESKNKTNVFPSQYAYFDGLNRDNLPYEINDRKSHDIISWYLQWTERRSDIKVVCHGVIDVLPLIINDTKIISQSTILPDLTKRRILFKYAIWGVIAIFISTLDFLRGRWWHAIILIEAAIAKQAQLLSKDSVASQYLFNNSNWIYRPLWTYEVEAKGSDISFYFYSTNCEAFKNVDGYPQIGYGWRAMNWPRYMVWDEYQADFVRRAVGVKSNINIVGPIWFQSSKVELPIVTKAAVAVFDVTPHRASIYCSLGLENEFYTPNVAIPFIEHVNIVTKKLDLLMLWKIKRNIGSRVHPKYQRYKELIAALEHVTMVEPDISPMSVIESSIVVISMPFTSTAIIAREMGKPSIYYDPTGLLEREDRASHGIPILSGCDELEAWLSRHIAISKSTY